MLFFELPKNFLVGPEQRKQECKSINIFQLLSHLDSMMPGFGSESTWNVCEMLARCDNQGNIRKSWNTSGISGGCGEDAQIPASSFSGNIFLCVQCRGQTTATDRVDYIIPEKTVPHRQRRQRHLSNYGHQMSAITRPSPPFLLSLLWVTDRPRFLFPPARGV